MTQFFRNLFFSTDKESNELRSNLKSILGFSPRNISLYIQALTHKSAIDENTSSLTSNERLEFLGDAILGSCVAHYLFDHFPDQDEGFLTQLRSKIVSRKNLNVLASKIKIDHLIISNIDSKQRINSVKGNAFEALIGAIYLDRGNKFAIKYIYLLMETKLIDIDLLSSVDENFKSQIIEYGQKNKKEIEFLTISENGNGYEKEFKIRVNVDGEEMGIGSGRSKKIAEQGASKSAISNLQL